MIEIIKKFNSEIKFFIFGFASIILFLILIAVTTCRIKDINSNNLVDYFAFLLLSISSGFYLLKNNKTASIISIIGLGILTKSILFRITNTIFLWEKFNDLNSFFKYKILISEFIIFILVIILYFISFRNLMKKEILTNNNTYLKKIIASIPLTLLILMTILIIK